MTALYVCSTEPGAGKTMVAVCLAQHLLQHGLIVNYIKASTGIQTGQKVENLDAGFVKRVLGLDAPLELMAPIQFPTDGADASPSATSVVERVTEAYQQLAKGKSSVLIEAGDSSKKDVAIGSPDRDIVSALSAVAVLVVQYRPDTLGRVIADARTMLGDSLRAVIVNNVPANLAKDWLKAKETELLANSIPVVGFIPKTRELLGVTGRELIETLGAEVLCCDERLDQGIDNVTIGTISHVDPKSYFERRSNKLVVVPAHRPDVQLAALASSTSCLLLTGVSTPDPYVLSRAAEVKVPVAQVKVDTPTVLENLQSVFGSARFRQDYKVDRAQSLLSNHVDLRSLSSSLGLL